MDAVEPVFKEDVAEVLRTRFFTVEGLWGDKKEITGHL
jgi:hypothetical protein